MLKTYGYILLTCSHDADSADADDDTQDADDVDIGLTNGCLSAVHLGVKSCSVSK